LADFYFPEATESKAILALASRHALELFDIVSAAAVIRVVLKDGDGAGVVLDEVAGAVSRASGSRDRRRW
jgi:hypothetical protein